MPTVEAVYVNGHSVLLEDCDVVGDVMAKIAIAHNRFATHIVVIDPASGKEMKEDEDIKLPKVEVVLLNEESAVINVASCSTNLRLHAAHSDNATCTRALEMLTPLDPHAAERVLREVVMLKKSKWREAMCLILNLGVSGEDALLSASEKGCVESVKALLSCSAVENDFHKCGSRRTLHPHVGLDEACSEGHAEVVKVLLDAAAIKDADMYMDAFMTASSRGHAEIVKMLLDAGMDVDHINDYGDTALVKACQDGSVSVAKTLLQAGADINFNGGYNGSALGAASLGGHVETVKMLLDAGANVNLCESWRGDEPTALEEASRCGNTSIVEILLNAGANIDANNGAPLRIASADGHVRVVKMLLDAGADINMTSGSNPLVIALREGHGEIVRMLEEKGMTRTHTQR